MQDLKICLASTKKSRQKKNQILAISLDFIISLRHFLLLLEAQMSLNLEFK